MEWSGGLGGFGGSYVGLRQCPRWWCCPRDHAIFCTRSLEDLMPRRSSYWGLFLERPDLDL